MSLISIGKRGGWAVVAVSLVMGCQQLQQARRSAPVLDKSNETQLSSDQAADMHVALGRSLEQGGDATKAMAAYRAAVARNSRRSDAYQRLAVIHDKQGKFEESARFYRMALELDPGNPEIYCDMGYSFYLQRRWSEAEMNLQQAIKLEPEHRRAHNNLGLVLAHTSRPGLALAAFVRGGSNNADAHSNLAFCLAMERRWEEAQQNYAVALALDPSCETARSGLRQLDHLVAQLGGVGRRPDASAGQSRFAASSRVIDSDLVIARHIDEVGVPNRVDEANRTSAADERELILTAATEPEPPWRSSQRYSKGN